MTVSDEYLAALLTGLGQVVDRLDTLIGRLPEPASATAGGPGSATHLTLVTEPAPVLKRRTRPAAQPATEAADPTPPAGRRPAKKTTPVRKGTR